MRFSVASCYYYTGLVSRGRLTTDRGIAPGSLSEFVRSTPRLDSSSSSSFREEAERIEPATHNRNREFIGKGGCIDLLSCFDSIRRPRRSKPPLSPTQPPAHGPFARPTTTAAVHRLGGREHEAHCSDNRILDDDSNNNNNNDNSNDGPGRGVRGDAAPRRRICARGEGEFSSMSQGAKATAATATAADAKLLGPVDWSAQELKGARGGVRWRRSGVREED